MGNILNILQFYHFPSMRWYRWLESSLLEHRTLSSGTVNKMVADDLQQVSHLISPRDDHDDVIKWKTVPPYWPFVRGIHWSLVNSPHKGQWCEALIFSLIFAWTNSWVNNREAGDLRLWSYCNDKKKWHGNTFPLLALWNKNPLVTEGVPSQRELLIIVFFAVSLNTMLSNVDLPVMLFWCHCNESKKKKKKDPAHQALLGSDMYKQVRSPYCMTLTGPWSCHPGEDMEQGEFDLTTLMVTLLASIQG